MSRNVKESSKSVVQSATVVISEAPGFVAPSSIPRIETSAHRSKSQHSILGQTAKDVSMLYVLYSTFNGC